MSTRFAGKYFQKKNEKTSLNEYQFVFKNNNLKMFIQKIYQL